MNEMDLLTRLRDEVPLSSPSPDAQRAFRAGLAGATSQRRARRHRRPSAHLFRGRAPLMASATAVAVGLTACIVVLSLPSSGRPPTASATGAATPTRTATPTGTTAPTGTATPTGPSLPPGDTTEPIPAQLLANVAAHAVLSQPAVKPTQWVYRKVEIYLPMPTDVLRHRSPKHVEDTWEMADGAHYYTPGSFQGNPGSEVPYSRIGSLPANPVALDAYLARLDYPNPNATTANKATAEFSNIADMLTAYVLPPKLTAELYHALADIPTVIAERNAKDIFGQVGLAFILPQNEQSMNDELFLRPSNYQLLGREHWLTGGPGLLVAQAVLAQAFVSASGKLP
jgi:hypothetical protein